VFSQYPGSAIVVPAGDVWAGVVAGFRDVGVSFSIGVVASGVCSSVSTIIPVVVDTVFVIWFALVKAVVDLISAGLDDVDFIVDKIGVCASVDSFNDVSRLERLEGSIVSFIDIGLWLGLGVSSEEGTDML